MQGGSDRRLQGFQIQAAPLAAILKDHPQQLAYFARDFLLDGFCRFFSCADREPATGRRWQIFALTSSNSALNWRKR
jgi:hypothetical protein